MIVTKDVADKFTTGNVKDDVQTSKVPGKMSSSCLVSPLIKDNRGIPKIAFNKYFLAF